MDVSILGTQYEFLVEDINDGDGVCHTIDKKIQIRPKELMLSSNDSIESKNINFEQTIRHELAHAFLMESGLTSYSDDEILVEWLAIQLPKLESTLNYILENLED